MINLNEFLIWRTFIYFNSYSLSGNVKINELSHEDKDILEL